MNLTRLLQDAYEADSPKPFNLFTVLRSSHDEVNLHSRFLAALLNHRDSRTSLKNLEDFVETVLKFDTRFDYTEARVERERDHIDILVSFGTRQAIVIENKIDAEDQDRQLYRYWETVEKRRVAEIRLVYLTLDGREPTEGSMGSLEESKIFRLGYNSCDFQNWLRNCHRRASGEPELRESIVQYLRLVQELTGTESKGDFMDALKKLLKEGENLTLASKLAEAFFEEKQCLMNDLQCRIKRAAEVKIPSGKTESWSNWEWGNATSLPVESPHPKQLYMMVQLYSQKFQWGIQYGEKGAKSSQKMIDHFQEEFNCGSDSWWLCRQDRNKKYSIEEDYLIPSFLAKGELRQACADEIAGDLLEMYKHLKKYQP